ncbi:protein C19orf12 homolog [Hyalella azteca]|uniref:Protein C19orf12 homolog n=1 Tax=Hyalella azteca TaxID=294128 RepID=A0A8B7P0D8_HYAAZ|nr:protein C19orf12 homolog [Hyalella azteca]XP_018019474.1 protein C19orf12 homolog [Hyalella azteca]
MVIEAELIMDVICEVARDRGLMICVKNSVAGGAAVGASATAGSLLLGPIGLLIGGTAGAALASWWMQGQYVSAVSAIQAMPQDKKDELVKKVGSVLRQLDITDVATTTAMILSSSGNVQELVARELINFLSQNMKMNVIT